MSCGQCKPEDCIAPKGWVCKDSGDFFTTGDYSNSLTEFDIHGVTYNQKIDSVADKLDQDTIRILKVLICDSNRWDYPTSMEIVFLLDEILSRLSFDNKNYSYVPGDDTND